MICVSIVNLFRNAVEAGERPVCLKVRTERTPHSVRMRVEDDGCGMTGEQMAHMFDPFYTTRQQKGGTGLGLSITHGIIASHGGSIDVQSRLGYGTVITVELPLVGSLRVPPAGGLA